MVLKTVQQNPRLCKVNKLIAHFRWFSLFGSNLALIQQPPIYMW